MLPSSWEIGHKLAGSAWALGARLEMLSLLDWLSHDVSLRRTCGTATSHRGAAYPWPASGAHTRPGGPSSPSNPNPSRPQLGGLLPDLAFAFPLRELHHHSCDFCVAFRLAQDRLRHRERCFGTLRASWRVKWLV